MTASSLYFQSGSLFYLHSVNNYLSIITWLRILFIHSEQELADYTTVIFDFYLFIIRQFSVLNTCLLVNKTQDQFAVTACCSTETVGPKLFTVIADNEVRR